MDFGACMLLLEDGTLLRAVARGSLMGRRKSLGNAVVVGDRARYETAGAEKGEGGSAVVVGVEPRRNRFTRRAPGKRPAEQVIAANLDQVAVVASMAEPPFNPGLADRVLSQATHDGIPARLVVNKRDLDASGGAAAEEVLADYQRAGFPGHAVSARRGDGLDGLRRACEGRRTLFVGHSGVGKSTLLNALAPGLELLAARVNPRTGKGRHTTTAAWMLRPAPGLELVDTPGVRAFGLWGIGAEDLAGSYPEFRPLLGRCRFGDCAHRREPGCALREAVEAGAVPQRRYASFLKLRDELSADRPGPGA